MRSVDVAIRDDMLACLDRLLRWAKVDLYKPMDQGERWAETAFGACASNSHCDSPRPAIAKVAMGIDGVRILLVDDDLQAVQPLSELLELEGAHVSTAAGAQEALGLLGQQTFDVLLSDLAMPGHDGNWLIAWVRQRHKQSSIDAIAMTGGLRPEDRQRALDAGFDAFLQKPFSLEDFKRVVEQLDDHQ